MSISYCIFYFSMSGSIVLHALYSAFNFFMYQLLHFVRNQKLLMSLLEGWGI